MKNKSEPIEKVDWRHRVATFLTEDAKGNSGEIIHPKGTPVTATSFASYDNKEIGFGDPSATALFLNQSYKAFVDAQKIQPFQKMTPLDSQRTATTEVFDYLELTCASIVFAYTALEAFVNEEIPDDFVYSFEEETEHGIFIARIYDKQKIERRMSLSEKLTIILPQVKNIPSPKGTSEWEGFVQLRRLRDRIIHMKANDRVQSKTDNKYPDSIWNELLNPTQRHYPKIAKTIILHFRDKESVHWLKYSPF